METRVVSGDVAEIQADAVVVNLFEGAERPEGTTAAVDEVLDGAISSLIGRGEARGKFEEISILHTLGKLPARIVAVIGLGKREDLDLDKVRRVTGQFCRTLRKLNCRRVATVLHGSDTNSIGLDASAKAVTEGIVLGLYRFTKYKKPDYEDIEEMLIVAKDREEVRTIESAVAKATTIALAANLARDMVMNRLTS